MAWAYLVAAGICEIIWAVGLKRCEGFTKPLESAVTIIVMILSFVLLSQAMKHMPLGMCYAIWTGIGAVGTTLYGLLILKEPRNAASIVCMMMIICGIVGLKVLMPKVS